MSAAFDAWLRDTFARTRGFTALLILVKRDRSTIWPLGSSYANVIGKEMAWRDFRDMLDRSKLQWDAVAIFPAAGPMAARCPTARRASA
jgi:hypothetical protein